MTDTRHPPFPYPGSKKRYANWIVSRLPKHHTYVEVFGGSGVVLARKPRSEVEIFNDINGDIVQFFGVLRERSDELVEWLERTPYSRELYAQWVREWQSGERPDDALERAGRFFYLRCTQFSGKTGEIAGFHTSTKRPEAKAYVNRIERLEAHAERFQGVTVENMDWPRVLDQYDDPSTVFYLDPPYGDSPEIYGGEFDHDEFFGALPSLEGDWLLSFQEHPDGLSEYYAESEVSRYQIGENGDGSENDRKMTEYLIMNHDPDERPAFTRAGQSTLTDGGFDG